MDAYLGRLDEARAGATAGASLRARWMTTPSWSGTSPCWASSSSSTGNHAAAAELSAPLVRRREARGAGEPSLYPARELAIEALVAVGDLDEARVQLGWLEEAGLQARDSLAARDGRALPRPSRGRRGRP